MSDIKTIINQGNLDGLTWDQLNAKLELIRSYRKDNIIIKALNVLLSREDNPYIEEEERIRSAMFAVTEKSCDKKEVR